MSGIIKLVNTALRKLDLFSSSGKGRKTLILLGPLGRANLKHWTLITVTINAMYLKP
jgi:hypothetical protein